MKTFLVNTARRLAPRTLNNIKTLSSLDEQFEQGPARFIDYEREIRSLRRDIDELRRDNRRVAELYDAVFEWARANAAAQGLTPPGDPDGTVRRIADEAARGEAARGEAARGESVRGGKAGRGKATGGE